MQKIVIRPSSLNTYISCPHQWYQTYILKQPSKQNARALVGTGVHKAVEVMWQECITHKVKTSNTAMMLDAGIDEYKTEIKNTEDAGKEIVFDDINDYTALDLIKGGVNAFVSDILPYTDIPEKVEIKLTKSINHKYVSAITGTIDYLRDNTIADIKTSKRKIQPSNYILQQSVYKMLAEENNYDIEHVHIQGVVFNKTKTVGSIDTLTPDISQVKYIMNNLLAKLDLVDQGANPAVVFSGNPKHYLCSEKYCSQYPCSFVTGK